MDLSISTKMTWYGSEVKEAYHRRFYTNLEKALLLLKEELKAACSHLSSGRGDHSSPGSPPFAQSENLKNSIQHFIEVSGSTTNIPKVEGGVGTDVEYAPILEYGGSLQVSPSSKIYATRPILPWGTNHTLIIAPRPFWLQTFQKLQAKMLEIIKSGF